MRFPPRPLLRRYAVRAFLLWIGIRACVLFALAFTQGAELARASIVSPGPLAFLFVLLGAAVAWTDIARLGERAMLGNLGIPMRAIAAIYALAAGAGETLRGALVALA